MKILFCLFLIIFGVISCKKQEFKELTFIIAYTTNLSITNVYIKSNIKNVKNSIDKIHFETGSLIETNQNSNSKNFTKKDLKYYPKNENFYFIVEYSNAKRDSIGIFDVERTQGKITECNDQITLSLREKWKYVVVD